ncbi:cell division protein FtsK [Streptomyces sp. NPDC056600]|uniref:cell division protein FtsK n=1 Tax=Streptomyces sp. NPDC056600 TaxID=3345874 RepID=UPI0036BA8EAA
MEQVTQVTNLGRIVVCLALAAALGWAVSWVVRYLRADADMRASMRQALRVRRSWRRLALMAGLTVTDSMPSTLASLRNTSGTPPRPRVLVPSLRVRADRYGVRVRARCLPRVGLEEYKRASAYLADAWGCTRVSVTQESPGWVQIRGVRIDPLLAPATHTPTGEEPRDLVHWEIGVDEYAQTVSVNLAEVPGVTIAGLPGFGKTSVINRFLCDCAPSPAVQFAVADGKVSSADEGDYAELVPRLFTFVGDDLEEANALFKRLARLRQNRSSCIRYVLGRKDMWHRGPSRSWPWVVLVIDEAHTYFRDHKGSDKESKHLAALAAENARLVEELVKKGRSVGILVLLATQKSTGDAIPTFIRDVCPVGMSFAQKTAEASVAALGDDIRQWPDVIPTTLQNPAYVGVAVMNSPGRAGFTRVRTPYVPERHAARIAAATAHLTADPSELLAAVTPLRPRAVVPDQTPYAV